MNELEKRKRRLLNLPSVENWTRNNRPRFDETFFALANFDRNPPQFGLGEVRKLCALLATGKLGFAEAIEHVDSIKHATVRASAREVLPAFASYLTKSCTEGVDAFDGFRITYPIGPRPGGGTLAIPIVPTFVGVRKDELVPTFVIPWASLPFDDFQKNLMSSILKDALLSHQHFIGYDAEIVAFPRFEDEKVRFDRAWSVRSYARMDREDLNRQFATFGRALTKVIDEMSED